MDIEFAVDVPYMRLRRTVGDEEFLLDGADRFTLRQKQQHFLLTLREPELLG